MSESKPACIFCGHPMPPGEEMFKFHGYSGPCPGPPLPTVPKPTVEQLHARLVKMHSYVCEPENCHLDGGPEHEEFFAGKK